MNLFFSWRFQERSATPRGLLNRNSVRGVSQNLSEDLQRRVPVQRGARSRVEVVSNLVEVLLRVDGQIGALGQVLAQQAVGVFARAALPRAVRVTEVDTHVGRGRQFGMSGHFATLIVGQGLTQRLDERLQFGREGGERRCSSRIGHL